uniref:C2H2-type domain-containing protein n=1 Tax=Myripristis murdjan TaxID=586833 RepID=A0A668AEM0_9TELE
MKRYLHEWKHTGHQPFQCPTCTKRFRSYSDLLEHQKKHTKAYPFLCWECGKKFRHSVTLTRHVERVHKSGITIPEKPASIFSCSQPYVCATCAKGFSIDVNVTLYSSFPPHPEEILFPLFPVQEGT